jgi:hypothetical protein
VDSVEHFFKEHDLGVGKNRRGRRLEYTVAHRPSIPALAAIPEVAAEDRGSPEAR